MAELRSVVFAMDARASLMRARVHARLQSLHNRCAMPVRLLLWEWLGSPHDALQDEGKAYADVLFAAVSGDTEQVRSYAAATDRVIDWRNGPSGGAVRSPHLRRDWGPPRPHLHRDWAHQFASVGAVDGAPTTHGCGDCGRRHGRPCRQVCAAGQSARDGADARCDGHVAFAHADDVGAGGELSV